MASRRVQVLAVLLLLLAGAYCQGSGAATNQDSDAVEEAAEEAMEAKLEAELAAEEGVQAATGASSGDKAAKVAEDSGPANPKSGLIAAEAEDAKEEQLEAQLETVEEAQEAKQDTSAEVVEAQIVEEAPKAKLFNGDGDVSTTDKCEDDVTRFCKKAEPGEGRLAACLTQQLEEEGKGNVEGRRVSKDCKSELRKFKLDRITNINKDVPLARACKKDVAKYCRDALIFADEAAHPSLFLDCLREKREKLSSNCKARVFEEQVEEAKDFMLDEGLASACLESAKRVCADVEEREGATLECLLSKNDQVDETCAQELQRVETQRDDDIRLSRPLFRKCAADIKRHCAGVEFGGGRVFKCLEEHREEEEFSGDCKADLEAAIERQSSSYKLNYGLRSFCADDIAALCSKEKEQLEYSESFGADSQVIACLEEHREEIKADRCRGEVRRVLEREGSDIRFDHAVAQACYNDRKKICGDVKPGSARVIRCLQDAREQLEANCAATLFQREIKLAEAIDFKFPLKQACAAEIKSFCDGVPAVHARVVFCLQENLDKDGMSTECKAEVKRDQQLSAHDYRLNYGIKAACKADVKKLCRDVESKCTAREGCKGLVLQCLRDNMDSLSEDACRKEVFRFVKAEVADFRVDVPLADACKSDVKAYCAGVSPGEGRVHACLRERMGELSPACRVAEEGLQLIQSRDVRLRPVLSRLCSEEIAVMCKDVAPGKARIFRCLSNNLGKPGFSEACQAEVDKRVKLQQADYRLDAGLAEACAADVDAQCAAAKGQVHGHGLVMKCLVSARGALSPPCAAELSRAVRLALWDYSPGGALTGVCDADVTAGCGLEGGAARKGVYSIGAVGRCLAKQAAEQQPLAEACLQLVAVAAPKDAQGIFSDSLTMEAMAKKVAELATAAGLNGTFVNPSASGTGVITLTGWIAMASIFAVAIVAGAVLVVVVRRIRGLDQPYTLVVKSGDV